MMIRKTATILLIAFATFSFTHFAIAQDSGAEPAANASSSQNEVRGLIKQLRQKSAELQQIHSQTLQSNADLRQQQEQFVARMRKEIKAQGYDLEAGQKRVQDMAGKLKNKDLSDAERKAITQKIAGERESLRKARAAALQQPDIQQASQDLQDATMTAMKKQNPDVQKLIDDMNSLRQQLRAAVQKARASAG